MRKWTVFGIALLAAFSALAYLAYQDALKPGALDGFAKCLSERGFVMAGTNWCHVCQEQKAMFGKSFRHIDFKNCEIESSWCDERNVTGYPTWFGPEGEPYRGQQSIEKLGALSDCQVA